MDKVISAFLNNKVISIALAISFVIIAFSIAALAVKAISSEDISAKIGNLQLEMHNATQRLDASVTEFDNMTQKFKACVDSLAECKARQEYYWALDQSKVDAKPFTDRLMEIQRLLGSNNAAQWYMPMGVTQEEAIRIPFGVADPRGTLATNNNYTRTAKDNAARWKAIKSNTLIVSLRPSQISNLNIEALKQYYNSIKHTIVDDFPPLQFETDITGSPMDNENYNTMVFFIPIDITGCGEVRDWIGIDVPVRSQDSALSALKDVLQLLPPYVQSYRKAVKNVNPHLVICDVGNNGYAKKD